MSSPDRPSRDAQRARTRQDLLAAAAQVFAEHGYHSTTIDMVAETAGYTKGAVYSNFSSKEALFLDVWEQHVHGALDDIASMVDVTSPEDRADAIAAGRAGGAFDRQWFLLDLEFSLYAARHPHVQERLRAHSRAVRGRVAAMVARHEAEVDGALPCSPEEVADLLVGGGDGLMLLHVNDEEMAPMPRYRRLLQVLLTPHPDPADSD